MSQNPNQEDLQATIQDCEKLLADLANLLPNHSGAIHEVIPVLQSLQNNPIVLDLLVAGLSLMKAKGPAAVRR